jgi:hypothetical protein
MKNKDWKISETHVNLKNGKYIVLYDPADPRNKPEPADMKHIICVIAPADKMDGTDFMNAAIMKESKNMLITLLSIKETLSDGIINPKKVRDLIDETLNKIYK